MFYLDGRKEISNSLNLFGDPTMLPSDFWRAGHDFWLKRRFKDSIVYQEVETK